MARVSAAGSLSWDDAKLLVASVVDYAIFMLDVDGNVLTWSLGAEKIKGYAASEIIGQHFSRFYPEDDIAAGKPERELQVAAAAGRVEDEGFRVRKDGSRFWASVVITALRDDDGVLRGFGKVTRDLTDRRKSEEELRRSEERFRLLLENIGDYAIYMLDPAGLVSTWNLGAKRMKGYAASEIIGRSFELLFPEEDRASGKPARELAAARRDGRFEDEGWRLRKDGTCFWANAILTALHDSRGELVGFAKITQELTARRAVEEMQRGLIREQAAREVERAQETQARYLAEATAVLGASLVQEEMLPKLAATLVPGLADWCSIYLLQGDRLRDVADAHADPEKRAAVQEYARKFPPDPEHAGGAWSVIRSGESEVIHDVTDEVLTRSTRDPEALALLRALGMSGALLVPIRVRSRVAGVIALALARPGKRYEAADVTLVEEIARRAGTALENAQLYAASQDAAKAAEEANRVKDEFLATVSHELRTPLNAIVGWSSVLRERVLDAAVVKPIEVIHRNALAQVKIIDDILDVSRFITGDLRLDVKPADIVAIARDAIDVVRPSAVAKGIALDFTASASILLLVADPKRLQQVVWNLVSNAVKFTDSGGKIEVSAYQVGSQLALRVRDTGAGIDPEFLPHVFERFRQADATLTRRFGGLGLGLALVRHIAELHGGRVVADSAGIGKGATFTITLPVRAVLPLPAGERVPSNVPPLQGAPTWVALDGVRVLVVDDEPDARDLIASLVVEAGGTVEKAQSAAEGFAALQRFRPHVLVSDVGMPEEDGFAFMRRIRAMPARDGGNVPALALTAFAREEDRMKASDAGYDIHVGKPVNPEVFVSTLARLARAASEKP